MQNSINKLPMHLTRHKDKLYGFFRGAGASDEMCQALVQYTLSRANRLLTAGIADEVDKRKLMAIARRVGKRDLKELGLGDIEARSVREQECSLLCPQVELVDFNPSIIGWLSDDPNRLRDLSPEAFENLICNRLDAMSFGLSRVGASAYRKDGGIDIVAWPRNSVVPYLIAVQVKHTSSPKRKIGPAPVRDLLGAIQMHGFNAGFLVTNTTFTPDARWVAEQRSMLLRLRDVRDLRRWLREEYLRDEEWRDIPEEIVVCPGVSIKLPKWGIDGVSRPTQGLNRTDTALSRDPAG